jgi:glycosyltransferase involved in cell wall biosynthesis
MARAALAKAPATTARRPAATTPELTILMPCLNEAETIEICVKKAMGYLARSGVAGEVLIADNGSTDGSQAMAEALGARVVAVPEKGYGAALIGGIKAARGKYVIMGDADDSYDFENLDGMVEHLRGGAELVMGNRFKGGIEPGAMPPLHKYLGNPVLSFIGRLFFAIPVGDFHCGLRGFSRESIDKLGLQSPGMEFASEMVVKASLNGLRIVETPTTLKKDGRSRPPHLKTWRDGWRHLRFLLLHSPRWLFIYPGLLLMVLGLLGSAVLSGRGSLQLGPHLELGVHSLIVACFAVVIGVQMLMFGALARRYQALEGILPTAARAQKFLGGFSLEPILQFAVVVFLVGLGGLIIAVMHWASSGFGPIPSNGVMRVLAVSLTAITVAIQLAAAGFLASVFALRR